MRYDVALPAPGVSGKARAAERGGPTVKTRNAAWRVRRGQPEGSTAKPRQSRAIVDFQGLAYVEQPRDARDALSCRGLAADAPPYLMTTRPSTDGESR